MNKYFLKTRKHLIAGVAILSIAIFLINVMAAFASVAANFTNNGGPAALYKAGVTNKVVLDVTIPDGMNSAGTEDTLVTNGALASYNGDALVGFDSAEPGLEVYLDHGTDNNTYDDGEDIFRQVHNGADAYSTGNAMQAFSANELSFYDDNTLGDNNDYNDGEAIISDADADGSPTAGDSVVTAGKAGVRQFEAADNVYLDDANSSGDYDAGEVIWVDVGDTGAFDAATDYILTGAAAPTCAGLCSEISGLANESGLAFLDDNNDGNYSSTRNTGGETVVWFGNAVDPTDGDSLTTAITFFDPAQLADDDIDGTWLEDLNDFNSAASTYGYISAGAYADGDDIFKLTHNGATTVFSDGDESRLFAATDTYVDNDTSTTYTDGENIYQDTGTTVGFIDKKADQLIGIGVQNTGTAIDTTDISAVHVWAEEGSTIGFQAGEDTDLGAMTVNSGDNKEWRLGGLTQPIASGGLRLYITVNIAAVPTDTRTMIFRLPILNDAGADGIVSADGDVGVFVSSNNDGPTDSAITNVNTQTIDTTAPTGTVTVGTPVMYDGDLIQEVTVDYSEPMYHFYTPTITFGGNVGAIVSNGDGAWTDADTWYETFTLTDANEETAGVTVDSSLARDLAENVEGADVQDTFNIDTKSPTPTVTTSPATIYEGALVSTVTVTYDEAMNPATSPVITMTGGNWGAQTPVGWTVGNTVYTATFTHDGTEEYIAAEVATVAAGSGATDVAGNAENGDASPSFIVDTLKPTGTVDAEETIYDGNLTQTVTITYDEAMDPLSTPTISFVGDDG
ncbi:hypothetical protein KJ835_02465, partial [Patescibacteria group bacterium]|nr:hypothetical protein [Patescibacteria group bacterium]